MRERVNKIMTMNKNIVARADVMGDNGECVPNEGHTSYYTLNIDCCHVRHLGHLGSWAMCFDSSHRVSQVTQDLRRMSAAHRPD